MARMPSVARAVSRLDSLSFMDATSDWDIASTAIRRTLITSISSISVKPLRSLAGLGPPSPFASLRAYTSFPP